MATQALQIAPAGALAAGQFTQDQIDLIKRTVAQGTTDDELALFMATCKRLALDPFAKQICAVKRWDSARDAFTMAIQVTIDGFRLVADRTQCYAPGRKTEYELNAKEEIVAATVYVKKFAQGTWHEFSETADWDEYKQEYRDKHTGEWKLAPLWYRMPRRMLAKCAEAAALRRAFPAELGGVYVPEEMMQADGEPRPEPPGRHDARKPLVEQVGSDIVEDDVSFDDDTPTEADVLARIRAATTEPGLVELKPAIERFKGEARDRLVEAWKTAVKAVRKAARPARGAR